MKLVHERGDIYIYPELQYINIWYSIFRNEVLHSIVTDSNITTYSKLLKLEYQVNTFVDITYVII